MSTTQSLAPPSRAANAPSAQEQKQSQPKSETNLGPALKVDPAAAITNGTPAHTFLNIPIGKIVPSKTNPRKGFDGPDMAELVESIRQCGVIQPALVRTRTANAADILRRGSILPLEAGKHFGRLSAEGETVYEIVAGERRYRAAVKAGLKELPAMVRPLSDGEVLELQIVENLQRKDVTALEESAGYVTLFSQMQKDEVKASRQSLIEKIAKRIGKSVRYVYARMKLDELIPEIKEEIVNGRLQPSHADELVRLTVADQRELFKRKYQGLFSGQYDGTKYVERAVVISVRDLKQLIERDFQLALDKAPFPLEAVAPACGNCPKNTANAPLLHPDVKKPTCTDRKCFAEKRTRFVHIEATRLQRETGAQRIVKVTEDHYSDTTGVLDRYKWKPAAPKSCNAVNVATVSSDGNLLSAKTVCTNDKCKVHFKKKESTSYQSHTNEEWKAQEAKRELIQRREQAVNQAVLASVLGGVKGLGPLEMRVMLAEFDIILDTPRVHSICELLAFPKFNSLRQLHGKLGAKLTATQSARLLVACAALTAVSNDGDLSDFAAAYKVDDEKIRKEVVAEFDKANAPKAETKKPTDKAKAPAAKRGTSAPKKKSAKRAAAKTAKKGGR